MTSSATRVQLSGVPAAGEVWTLNVGGVNFSTATLTQFDTLSSVASMLADKLRAGDRPDVLGLRLRRAR